MSTDDSWRIEELTSAKRAEADGSLHVDCRRLDGECDFTEFRCGEREIDAWVREKALKEHNTLKLRVVTAHQEDAFRPVGFYALSLRVHPAADLTANTVERRLIKGQFVSLHLHWIAVHAPMQRRGLGTDLMARAIDDFYEIATRTGVRFMTLVSISEDTKAFYEKLGFEQYGTSLSHPKMLLPAQSVIEVREQYSKVLESGKE